MEEGRPEEMLRRLRHQAEHETWMMISVALSLCMLLLVAVLVVPVFGSRGAALTGALAALGIFLLCYLACVTRVTTRRKVTNRWPVAALSKRARVAPARDALPEDPPGDRLLAAFAILAAGALALMLVWLVGR
jgi:hypothetical protein